MENYSVSSFCVLSSLISKNIDNYNQYSNTIRAVCYQMHCSERSLTIQINNDFIVCPRAGGKINAKNYDGFLSCPDYNLICSGTILCNDMFDCVEKRSLLKDVVYDYDIKTTQDIEVINSETLSDEAYELSLDGKCPQHCMQCNQLGYCLNCRDGYGIVHLTEEENTKRICMLISELDNRSFYRNEDEGIYYQCIDNCLECSNGVECNTCKTGYLKDDNKQCFLEIKKCINYNENKKCTDCDLGYEVIEEGNQCKIKIPHCLNFDTDEKCTDCEGDYILSNNICYQKIEKCEIYGENGRCSKCENGYGFEEDDRLNCKDINEFGEYYSRDGISYLICDGEGEGRIENCKKCRYDDELICNECKNNYVLKDGENNICYLKDNINSEYYYVDELHIRLCSQGISNCKECEKEGNDLKCTKCENNYYFVDEDYYNCIQKELINPLDEYYYDEVKKGYFSCGNNNYNAIENCKKCNNGNSCNLCKDGFTFIDDNKLTCNNINDLGNYYFQDLTNNIIYRKCIDYIANCNTCISKDECTSCIDQYGIYKDKTRCVNINDNSYYKKIEDNLYYLCSESIDNCKECSSESVCTSCISNNYININNKCFLKIAHCSNYDENGKCTQCALGYEVIAEENKCEITIVNCVSVNNEGKCIECDEDFILSNTNICFEKIENCEFYEEYEKCRKCLEGYGFEENDRLNCKDINEFDEYYSRDGISYLKCDGEGEGRIKDCKKCIYKDDEDELICNECKDNYVLKEDESDKCYSKEIIKKEYYYIDEFHIRLCSEEISKCKECEKDGNDLKCMKCDDNYYIVDEDYSNCKLKELIIPPDEYYYHEEKNKYYSCGNSNYNSIENCKKCDSGDSCTLCKDGFTFIDDDKSICKNIEQLGNEYCLDILDETIYRKCNHYIANCHTCLSKDECLSCESEYGLYFTKTKCIDINDKKYYENNDNNLYYLCSNTLDNCLECTSESTCITCISSDYFIQNNKCLQIIEHCTTYNNNGKCTECSIGYEPNDDGTSCKIGIGNCVELNDQNGLCLRCDEQHRLANNNCYGIIENCKIYENGENCEKCEEEYAFEENNKLLCKDIGLFGGGYYYSKDSGKSYFKCHGDESEGERIRNCNKCNYENNELICNECKEDYVLKDDENNICYSKTNFNNDRKYYYEDSFHVKTCSKTINNCEQCEKNNGLIKCKKCFENYFFVDENYQICINKIQITPINEYFIGNNNLEYFSCLRYNLVRNCKQCDNKNTCNLCKEGFTFIDDNKAICKDIEELGEEYYQDPNDNTIYRKCSYSIENCKTCSSANECLSCQPQYNLYHDKSKCIDINDKHYFKKADNYHYLCSESISNCDECSSETQCITCKTNYIVNNNICIRKIENCVNYDENGKCIECSPGCVIIQNGNKCKINIDHCISMNNDGLCLKCTDNYRLSNNICYQKIDNCELYEIDERCKKCKEGYGFEEDDRLHCKNIEEFEEYYSRDGISYLKCDGEDEDRIKNCRKCEYDQDVDELICNECKNNYILKDDENNKCYSTEIITKEYYYVDGLHIRLCSKEITNCKECEKEGNELKCTKCENNFYLVDEDYSNCKLSSEITPFTEYYLNDEKDHYYSCGNKNYNSIENCQKCVKKNTCYLCKEGYTFIDENKKQCKSKEDLGNEYIQDIQDPTINRKCNYYIYHCNTCSSKDQCLSCMSHYGLSSDKKKCIYDNDSTYYKNPIDDLYYLCSEQINKCEKCTSNTICNKCLNGYIRVNNDKTNCLQLRDINTDEYYVDSKDKNMYIKCSSSISNCYSCKNETECNYCNPGYLLINDDYTKCVDKTKLNILTYFTNDGSMYYSCNITKYKNNLKCFSLIPKQNIILKFVQIQKINQKLYCYMYTYSPLPKDFSLKLKLSTYTNSDNLRILEESKNIVFTTNEDSDGSENKIITFISDNLSNDLKDTNTEVKIEDIKFNNDNPTTKIVIDKNACSINFDKNSELLDTGAVKSLIKDKKIPDCSKSQQKQIVDLNMDKIDGCEFKLNSDEYFYFNKKSFDLELVEYQNKNNKIVAKCNSDKNKVKEIQCKINDNVNNDYSLKDELISDSNKFISINSVDNNNKFNILCDKKKNNNKKVAVIVSVICCCVVLIIVSIIIIYIYQKKKIINIDDELKKEKNKIINDKKNMTTQRKINKNKDEYRMETEQYLNINKNKRKKDNIFNNKRKRRNSKKKNNNEE